jgi:hypothetical protein
MERRDAHALVYFNTLLSRYSLTFVSPSVMSKILNFGKEADLPPIPHFDNKCTISTMLFEDGKSFKPELEIYRKDRLSWVQEVAMSFDMLPPIPIGGTEEGQKTDWVRKMLLLRNERLRKLEMKDQSMKGLKADRLQDCLSSRVSSRLVIWKYYQ